MDTENLRWRGTPVWQLLLTSALVAFATWIIRSLLNKEREERLRSDEFMAEVQSKFGFDKTIPRQAIAAYESKKTEIYNDTRVKGTFGEGSTLEEESVTLETANRSWLRKIGNASSPLAAQHAELCRLLIHRSRGQLNRYGFIMNEVRAKHRLFERKLIDQEQWDFMIKTRNAVVEEISLIKLEAEKLKHGFGTNDEVIKMAAEQETLLRRRHIMTQQQGAPK